MTNPLYDPYAVLQKVYGGGAYLQQALASTPVDGKDRARTVKICYGVLENDKLFDLYIRTFAPKTPKLPVRILLKVAMFMIVNMNKPRYMVTDNAVALAKKLGKGGAAGFLNAFLRAFDPARAVLPADEAEALSVRYSYPVFAVKKLLSAYGRETAEAVMAPRPARTFVRFQNEETARRYTEGSAAEKTPFPGLYAFPSFVRGAGYDAGEYTFQSVGSVAVCAAVGPCARLLDACAAPGGKSVLLAGKCRSVTAFELHPHRAELIRAYARRMGADNIEIVCRDSSVFDARYEGAFDAVLVDAPCSGFGVAGEDPDIRLFRKEEDMPAIESAQRAILAACSRYVRAGGDLYYSTCSVLPEENDGAVAALLQGGAPFSVREVQSPLAHQKTRYGIQFLPHISAGAGFYVSRLHREG